MRDSQQHEHSSTDYGMMLMSLITNENWDDARILLANTSLLSEALLSYKDPEDGGTILHQACFTSAPLDIIKAIGKRGGVRAIHATDNDGWTCIHHACYKKNASLQTIRLLVEIGGADSVQHTDHTCGWNSLHHACDANAPLGVIEFLIEKGGNKIIHQTDANSWTCLHWACENHDSEPSPNNVEFLIQKGGDSLINATDQYGRNPLHIATRSTVTNLDIIKVLVENGGIRGIHAIDKYGMTPLYYAMLRSRVEIANYLLELDHNVLYLSTNGSEALSTFVSEFVKRGDLFRGEDNEFEDMVVFLLKKGIQYSSIDHHTVLESTVGGIFASSGREKSNTTLDLLIQKVGKDRAWEMVMPIIDTVSTPLLHAAINSTCSAQVIQDIVERFENCAFERDNQNRLPVQIAAEKGLKWDEGFKHILEANLSAIQEIDHATTGLPLLALAAEGLHKDLSSIYVLTRESQL
jgi:ankyrin repeat protein